MEAIKKFEGVQHYQPIGFGASKEKAKTMFKNVLKHDMIKQNWCKKMEIPFLIIPYWDFNKIPEILEKFV